MIAAPLAGRRVLVTRAQDDAERWASRLEPLGAVPVILPCLVSEPLEAGAAQRALHAALHDAAWLVLSSPRGAVIAAALQSGALRSATRVAVVGDATAAAARAAFGRVDFVATVQTSAGLGDALSRRITQDGEPARQPVVLVGALGGRDEAALSLRRVGAPVRRVDIYRTLPAPAAAAKRDLARDTLHDILLASPSAVAGLLNLARVPAGARVITVGPTTSAAARDHGLTVSAEARRPTFEGLLEAMT
jgi:uroporphyrinogen-III synthase